MKLIPTDASHHGIIESTRTRPLGPNRTVTISAAMGLSSPSMNLLNHRLYEGHLCVGAHHMTAKVVTRQPLVVDELFMKSEPF